MIFTLLLATSWSATKKICLVGPLMDNLCVTRGTLVDNPTLKTLDPNSPAAHSAGCLFDVQGCVDSGYGILCTNSTGGNWGVAFKFDAGGNTKTIAWSKTNAKCKSCTGTLEKGLMITVKGSYDDASTAKPRVLTVDTIEASTVGCAGFVGETSIPKEKCIFASMVMTAMAFVLMAFF
jgi:hypothetical protein